ncbi:Nucleotidyl transferase AbiEii toxin, Type IV TA system [Niabella drilacis]|uniref:Nucleotidyl transferase AbiEii toxin, Type IV TA system n=2 Tax=Niabella drilacis (strain DSM 25811 / CCM 8410 / CCUG 62505 / LMG 26954 / E90) TaxID=1285928 RepID=A0A1G6UW90_NIADE|nr:Nucleotidyl transferase AbiEii toxin, Type IV TA system [Niabella drilacis]
MTLESFKHFRLVGGTSLSLQFGHRESVDIDLFTDETYGSIDFLLIEKELKNNFTYVKGDFKADNGMGVPCFIGNSENDAVKLDLFYTDPFVFPLVKYDHIRLAAPEEIAAMKLEVVGRGGRKKDFWDLHELLDRFTLTELLSFYSTRYPFSYSENELLKKLVDFSETDNDFNPKCYRQKYWELIRLDFEELVLKYQP